jgi:hypothetical protein
MKLCARAGRGALYLVFLALVFEGGSRLLLSIPAVRTRVEGPDDASFRLRWTRRTRNDHPIYYGFDEQDPIRGWRSKPNVRDLRVYGDKVLNTNSRGARGQREHAQPKPKGVARILVFGDSFSFGDEVSDHETFCAYLEELLPGVEVVNLGVHGYGHDQMLLYLKEVGAQYQPDVVLLGFLYDDMERNVLRFRDFAKPRYELREGALVLTGTPVPSPEQVLAREPWRSRFFDVLTMLDARRRARNGQIQEETQRLTTAILDEFDRTATSIGARTAFAYLPVWGELTRTEAGRTARETFFFQYCRNRGIQSMYLQPFFLEKARAGVRFKAHGHWGPIEHRTAAEGMMVYLLEKGLISGRSGPGSERYVSPGNR